MKPVRIGCSGWMYDDWRGRIYPEGLAKKRWLERYAQVFDTVEVNSTFYRLASRDAVAEWVERTPEDFLFSVKASRYLTHMKRLTDLDRGIRSLLRADRAHGRRGPARAGALAAAGELSPRRRAPRRRARSASRTGGTASSSGTRAGSRPMSMRCSASMASRSSSAIHPQRPFQAHELTAEWTFLRFHYGSRGRGGNYSEAELETWKRRIAAWRRARRGLRLLQQRLEGLRGRQRPLARRPPDRRGWRRDERAGGSEPVPPRALEP